MIFHHPPWYIVILSLISMPCLTLQVFNGLQAFRYSTRTPNSRKAQSVHFVRKFTNCTHPFRCGKKLWILCDERVHGTFSDNSKSIHYRHCWTETAMLHERRTRHCMNKTRLANTQIQHHKETRGHTKSQIFQSKKSKSTFESGLTHNGVIEYYKLYNELKQTNQ